jgi:hypothetical protein
MAAPAAFLALVWLVLGIAPVLVTGPGLSTTQAIGALPVLYVFPALAVVGGYGALRWLVDDRRRTTDDGVTKRSPENADERFVTLLVVCGLLSVVFFAAQTARDYFGRWANAPEVRVQYETAMVTALRYLDEHGDGDAVVSTITPGAFHTPAVALLTLRNLAVTPRWFDGRQSLVLPLEAGGTLVVPGFTPIPDTLQPYLADATLIDELPLRPDDLDRPVRIYQLNQAGGEVAQSLTPLTEVGFNYPGYLSLAGYDLSATAAQPGDTLSLVTAWRLEQPLPDAMLFAHLLGPDGTPVAQADALGAPGESWHDGDVLLQLHSLTLPPDTPAGEYPLAVGLYTTTDGQRLTAGNGTTMQQLATVTVADE